MKRWLSLLLALTMLLAMASTASAAEITDLNTYETTNQEMQHFNIFYSQSKTELDVLSNCIDGLLTNDLSRQPGCELRQGVVLRGRRQNLDLYPGGWPDLV